MTARPLVALLLLAAPAAAQDSLDALLAAKLAPANIPAMGAAVVRGGQLVAIGAAGTRRAGADVPATPRDRWHLGSNTKAFTALLAATFVEEGKLRWDSTVGEVFGPLPAESDAITLKQLLSHSGGTADGDFDELLVAGASADGDLDRQRAAAVAAWRPRKLKAKPGEKFEYANINYIAAGAMLEKVSGKTWEELAVDRLFRPLGLDSAGFGPASALGRVDAPLGHRGGPKARRPVLAGPAADNLPLLGPAGTMHLGLTDFAKWAGWNAGQGRRGPAVVKPETLKFLHAGAVDTGPGGGRYALGWGVDAVDWAPAPLLTHAGSNTMNLSQIWVDPAADLAVVVNANAVGKGVDEALTSTASELYRRYVPKGNRP